MSIQIQKVTDKSFRKYGRILTGEDRKSVV